LVALVVFPAGVAVRFQWELSSRWFPAAKGDISGFTHDIARSGAVICLNFVF
jgi:hypothetical protein